MTYNAASYIADCLESLLLCKYPAMRIVVVDNASTDDTVATVRAWTSAAPPALRADWPFAQTPRAVRPVTLAECGENVGDLRHEATVTLVHARCNQGFAGGSNIGLRMLLADPAITYLWNLNPDTLVDPRAPAAFVARAAQLGRFAVIGPRIVYVADPGRIQLDGGRLSPFTAAVKAINSNRPAIGTPAPAEDDLDFISGASMFASREFILRAGLMDPGYFLYYEEIDWQLRRGDLPLAFAADAVVFHHSGAAIGSGGITKPSPLSVYFTHRNLPRFVARWFPLQLPAAYLFAWARMLTRLDGSWIQFVAFLTGLHQLPPPAAVRDQLVGANWRPNRNDCALNHLAGAAGNVSAIDASRASRRP